MKAAVFKEVGKPLRVESVSDPVPRADGMVMKVAYCGVCGTDLHATREGLTTACPGQILGHEFVGEIAEVGPRASGNWRIGDRVCSIPFLACGHCVACATGRFFECQDKRLSGVDSPGGFAEYVNVGSRETLLLPDDLELQRAALVEPLAVGIHAVRMSGLRAGSRVLVIGAGPIGLTVSLWARFFGAREVVVSEMAAVRAELARRMGATAVIQPRNPADTQALLAQFNDVAGGPPEIIFECVGAPGLLQQCIEIAPQRGKVIPVGVCEQPDVIVPFFALAKELQIQFAIAYTRDDFETCVAMLGAGRIDVSPMVTDVVDLDGLPGAFEALRTPGHQCKVLARI